MKYTKIFLLMGIMMTSLIMTGCGSDDTPEEIAEIAWQIVDNGGRHIYNGNAITSHSCGITTGGELYCWGPGGEGQLGAGNRQSTATPQQVGESATWTDVAVGGGFTCGIDAGQLFCWGSNRTYPKYGRPSSWGLLGLGDSFAEIDSVDTPTQVGASAQWVEIKAGTNHACAIGDDGTDRTLWCWGSPGSQGALGNDDPDPIDAGYYDNKNEPTQEEGMHTDWATIETGHRSATFGIRDDGTDQTLWFFGRGLNGLGDVDQATQVGAETDWVSITSGAKEFCGIRDDETDQTLWCFGNNYHGQLGNDTDIDVSFGSIAQIGTNTNWSDVNMGPGATCGIESGDLYCWGRNHEGELGLLADLTAYGSCRTHDEDDFEPADCWEPELVSDALTWTSVKTANGHSCGITDDQEMYCWGMNHRGQLGVGNTVSTTNNMPTKIEL